MVGGDAAMLYVADTSNRRYLVTASVRLREAAPVIRDDVPLLAELAVRLEPLVLETDLDWGGVQLAETFPVGSVIVPLGWRGSLTGFIVVGPERNRSALHAGGSRVHGDDGPASHGIHRDYPAVGGSGVGGSSAHSRASPRSSSTT